MTVDVPVPGFTGFTGILQWKVTVVYVIAVLFPAV